MDLKSREEGLHMTLPQKASWPLFEAEKVRMTSVSIILPNNYLWLPFSAEFCLLPDLTEAQKDFRPSFLKFYLLLVMEQPQVSANS